MAKRKNTDGLTRTISIAEIAHALGVQLEGNGNHLAGRCPIHDGAGFTIDPANNTWSCTTCDTSGGAVDLVMAVQGISRRHAIELLKVTPLKLAPPSPQGPTKGGVPEVSTRRILGSHFDPDADDQALLMQVVGFYAETLKNNDEAHAYLDKRRLNEKRVIDRFKLGLANRTLGYRLPATSRKGGAAIRSRLQALGVLRPSGHEHFAGSLVVPVFDSAGHVSQVYGRKIGERLRAGTKLHLWLPNKPRALFNVAAFTFPEIIITDSVLNALTFIAHGVENVVGLPGGADTDELVAAVSRGNTKKVTLAFRRTADADFAAEKLAQQLAGIGVEVHRLVFPHGMDASDLVASVSDPPKALLSILRSAEWMAGTPATTKTTMVSAPPMITEADPVTAPVVTSKASDTDELLLTFDDRRWRIRDLSDNTARGTLRLNLFVSREVAGFHVDRFDLYSARHRSAFTKVASAELGVEEKLVTKDLGLVLLAAEQTQGELLSRQREARPVVVEMSEEDRRDALRLLRDPKLLDRLKQDFANVGVVGESDNLLLAYLVATSRKLRQPLAVIVQSSSAAGKSSLMKAALSFVPEEDQHNFSAVTGQSLYYVAGSSLKHKVLAIAEEAGAQRASYALKLLQSEGFITIASTGKEPGSGRLVSQEYRVEGPAAIFTSTTNIEIDDELLNRCVVLMVDESPEQTARIHAQQRNQMTLEGLLAHEARAEVVRLQQNAQRLLRPIKVVLPDADTLSFPDLRVRARRDFRKLLGLVEVVALLHQHQRQVQRIERGDHIVEYIEATEGDIAVARQLFDHVGGLGVDDLPPATRHLLVQIDDFVSDLANKLKVPRPEIRLTRRQVREALGIGDTASKIHLARLVDAEFLLAHRAPHGRGVVYSLAFNGGTDTYDDEPSGHGHPLVGPRSPQGHGEVASRSEGSTTGRKAVQGKSGVRAPRKRNRPPSQKKRTVRSSARRKKRRT